jgi:hypothetical protein
MDKKKMAAVGAALLLGLIGALWKVDFKTMVCGGEAETVSQYEVLN